MKSYEARSDGVEAFSCNLEIENTYLDGLVWDDVSMREKWNRIENLKTLAHQSCL